MTSTDSKIRWLAAALLALAAALCLAACGGEDGGSGSSGGSASTIAEGKAIDAELLNVAIGQELSTIDLYEFGLPLLGAEAAPVGRQLLGQTQEHLDALTKSMRGLGGEVEAEAEELDLSEAGNEKDFLVHAYEKEMAGLAFYEDLVTQLAMPAPRRLATAIAASKAQHIAALRQLLGADLLESFPEAFDSSAVPAPGAPPEE